jgi:FAD synthetase
MRVLVFGTFDGLHPGHRFLLDEAGKRGELMVVIARDENVVRFKGKTAKFTEEQRKQAIVEAYPDATVVLGDRSDVLVPVRALRPDLILLGYDQRMPPGIAVEDLPAPVERIEAFEPHRYKSSIINKDQTR